MTGEFWNNVALIISVAALAVAVALTAIQAQKAHDARNKQLDKEADDA